MRKLGEMLEDLFVLVDSYADLLRRIWSLGHVRGDEHGSPRLEALVRDHLTGFVDFAEFGVVLDEILNVVTFIVLMAALGFPILRVLVRILPWSHWYDVLVFFKIEIITLLLSHIIFEDLNLFRFLLLLSVLYNIIDLILLDQIILLAFFILAPGGIFRAWHLIDLMQFARLRGGTLRSLVVFGHRAVFGVSLCLVLVLIHFDGVG